ncbi:MAG: hypothetical protein ALECFALPRED_007571 [Alectoria fallacina]|uniref:NAD(+) synthase [glutamine-hydrolyzing] n=1 Tax=Alectoria fallacina TaxID=1903189 RepID=A0A8H3G808_9LECA|nr:MAG: hypothetical protein ALECFALPRED_007571 [Alectoria fallacina]
MSLRRAKNDGSALVITPELSITGYACLDEFLAKDTTMHRFAKFNLPVLSQKESLCIAFGVYYLKI